MELLLISNVTGWLGVIFLIMAFSSLITRFDKYFLHLDFIATILLLVHAIIIGDLVFTVVNTYIALVIIIRLIRRKNGGV